MIVRLIAAEMVAEVCSCYLVRPGEVLELFATVGLNPEAVHRTRLRVGEGLVGAVAALGRVDRARRRAVASQLRLPSGNRGGNPFQSFLGVPILREGQGPRAS